VVGAPAEADSPPTAPLDHPSGGSRLLRFLREHPILCLAILTPGIPEYLSTSTPVLSLVTNPVGFALQLAVNVGQYTAGALLVREALIRWRKGWGTALLLGLAYAITEEGLGDNTLFNSGHGVDGVLGSFGRYAGVNWVWSTGVLAFHVIYSIGLPILLLGLALPATRGRSLLGPRGIALAVTSLAITTFVEMELVLRFYGFWLGWPLFLASVVVIAVLVVAARRLPSEVVSPRTPLPTLTATGAGVIGFAFFPSAFLLEYSFTSTQTPPELIIAVELLVFGGLAASVLRGLGKEGNEYVLVNLAFGFVLWQSVFGVLLTLGLPYTLPLVAVAVWFFVRLRRTYRPRRPATAPTEGDSARAEGPSPPGPRN